MGSNPTTSVIIQLKLMFKSVLSDQLFPDFFYSCELEFDPGKISEACEELKINDPRGVNYSNVGGWQSKPYGNSYESTEQSPLKELTEKCIEFTNAVCQKEKTRKRVKHYSYWVNLNNTGNFNSPHYHNDTHVIGIYYPRVPENSGDLVIVRTDSGSVNALFTEDSSRTMFAITPEAGRYYVFPGHLLHYVTPSKSTETRISIAYGFKCV